MMSDASRERRAQIFEVASFAVMASVSGVVDGMEEAQTPSAKEEPHSISEWLVEAMVWTIVVWYTSFSSLDRNRLEEAFLRGRPGLFLVFSSTRKLCLRIVPATGSFRDVGCAGGMVVA
jgi:hypothetical protein